MTSKHVFTDTNLKNRRLLTEVVNHLVDQLLVKAGDTVDHLTHLIVDVELRKEGKPDCNYYFVQHDKRLVFWLDDFDEPMRIYEDVKGVKSGRYLLPLS